jgi:hypothetical protein
MRVVPAVRSGVRLQADLLVEQRHHALPGVGDVAGRTPQVPADVAAPQPRVVRAPFADAVDDVAAGRGECVAHRLVPLDRRDALVVAVVVLQIVDPPVGEGLGVDLLVSEAGRQPLAGRGAGRGVDAELESLRVDVVGEGRDPVREVDRIRLESALRVALGRHPAVVDVDVLVAGVGHAGLDDDVGGVADQLLVDVAAEGVPAVPPHRRGRREVTEVVVVGRLGRGGRFGRGGRGNEERGEGEWSREDGEGGGEDGRSTHRRVPPVGVPGPRTMRADEPWPGPDREAMDQ